MIGAGGHRVHGVVLRAEKGGEGGGEGEGVNGVRVLLTPVNEHERRRKDMGVCLPPLSTHRAHESEGVCACKYTVPSWEIILH